MSEPERTEWQIRCAFNGFCKRVLKYEAINHYRDTKRKLKHEVSFSDLSPQEEKQLHTVDRYFEDGDEDGYCIKGLKITSKMLAEALHTLPKEKRQVVLMYYFLDKSDVEIAEELNIPRSTVQYRRTSSFEQLKKYLEENANEWDEY